MRLATLLLLLAPALGVMAPTPAQPMVGEAEFTDTPLQEEETAFTPTPVLELQEEEASTGWMEVGVETYWSGTAPLCMGGCMGKHTELRRDPCGESNCCWVGYKSLCIGVPMSLCIVCNFCAPALCCETVNCGKPDADFYAVVSGSSWWVGSVVRHTCRPGFLLIGNSSSTCQPNGKWTPKPTCLRICQQNRLEINERDIDGNCSSTCSMKPYAGLPKRGCVKIDNCQSKEPGWKRWFTACDNCVCNCYASCMNCGKPDADFYAVVSGSSWWVGSVVRHTCRPGFLLIGNSSSTCQPNGKWTPKPTCLRICQQNRLEINERDIDGNCSSTCSMKPYAGLPKRGSVKIDNCQSKEPGWKRWFTACDNCVCNCYASCISSV